MYLFFFNDTPTTEIYTSVHTLSLHDALPISPAARATAARVPLRSPGHPAPPPAARRRRWPRTAARGREHPARAWGARARRASVPDEPDGARGTECAPRAPASFR